MLVAVTVSVSYKLHVNEREPRSRLLGIRERDEFWGLYPGTARYGLNCGGPLFARQWVERCVAQILERPGRRGREGRKRKASPPSVGNTVVASYGVRVLDMPFRTRLGPTAIGVSILSRPRESSGAVVVICLQARASRETAGSCSGGSMTG